MLQSLSNELIFEILTHFLPGLHLSVSEPYLFPWYLGEICSTWRAVFISSPQFWSTLTIHLDLWNGPKAHLPDPVILCKLVEVALERSKDYPLSISLMIFHAAMDKSPLSICSKDILKMLVTHSIRWRNLRISLYPALYPILQEAKDRLSILHSINVPFSSGIRRSVCPDIFDDSEDIFTGASKLKRMCFNAVPNWKLDWSSVAVIHFHSIFSLDEMIPILQHTSALEELVIADIQDDSIITRNIVSIHLPSLKRLYLPSLFPLSQLRTPALEELSVRNDGWLDDFEIESLDMTLSNYFSTVRNLRKLAIYTTKVADARPILAQAPETTRELILSGSFVPKQLKFTGTCQRLHNLKSISLKTRYTQEISYLLATVQTWAQETQSGLGPFKNLSQFSIHYIPDKNHTVHTTIKPVKRLRKVVEACGIRFISKMVANFFKEIMDIPSF